MFASSISTLGAISSPRRASWRWAITTAHRGCRGISNCGSRPFGAKANPPGRAVPPIRPSMSRLCVQHRVATPGRTPWRPPAAVTVIDVPFAAIAGAREIRGKITHGPGLRVAAGSDVVEPGARQYLLAATGPGVRDQLADQRQIADRGADAAGGAG